jgi:hypothetical protein
VGFAKLGSWLLLIIIGYTLVALIWRDGLGARQARAASGRLVVRKYLQHEAIDAHLRR